MTSNVGAVPWKIARGDKEEGGDGGSVGETASVELPELNEGRAVATSVQRLLSDLNDRAFSPRTRLLELGGLQSLPSVGLGGTVSNLRVGRFSFKWSSDKGPTDDRQGYRRYACKMSYVLVRVVLRISG